MRTALDRSLMTRISLMRWLRKPALRLLKRVNFDFEIKHHWVGSAFLVNAYQHKGYWYHGRKREQESIDLCYKFIKSTDTVIEAGGHIGYLSVIFAALARRLVVFEPGPNNLRYLRRNLQGFQNVEITEKALANKPGRSRFYLDSLTGQNNSLLEDYKTLLDNQKLAVLSEAPSVIEVEVTTIDEIVLQQRLTPNFIKIDVEGAELNVLRGMQNTLERFKPKTFLEITENHSTVEKLLRQFGYELLDEFGGVCPKINRSGNYFAIHHSEC
jgi:FkbM family methyltransferase